MSTATDCPDCTKARAGVWGGYSMNCQSCAARAIAKSPAAFEALSNGGDSRPLSAMVDHIMGDVPREQTVGMVREWVRIGRTQT